jgi:hypothetical protein
MEYQIGEIIGMECTHCFEEEFDESTEWTESNTVKCKVTDITFIIEDSYSYQMGVGLCLEALGNHNLDNDQLTDMSFGVCLESVIF